MYEETVTVCLCKNGEKRIEGVREGGGRKLVESRCVHIPAHHARWGPGEGQGQV
jgi:hypothetical protein